MLKCLVFVYFMYRYIAYHYFRHGEYIGTVLECLTRAQGVASSSLTGGTALCSLAKHFILCLVLVQHRTIRSDMTEKVLTGT